MRMHLLSANEHLKKREEHIGCSAPTHMQSQALQRRLTSDGRYVSANIKMTTAERYHSWQHVPNYIHSLTFSVHHGMHGGRRESLNNHDARLLKLTYFPHGPTATPSYASILRLDHPSLPGITGGQVQDLVRRGRCEWCWCGPCHHANLERTRPDRPWPRHPT